MNTLSFVGLVQNAALLLSLVLVFDVFALRWRAGQDMFSRYRMSAGLIIGTIGIAIMMTPWVLIPGLVFDTRSVLLSISGLFFGAVPTGIAMVITAALRLYQGGPGVWPGVSTVLVTGSLGLVWRRVRRGSLDEIALPELYLFGLVTHVIMLLLMFTLPWEMALHTLSNISVPVLVIYPLASTLLGGLMANRLRREKLIDERLRAEEKLAQERRLLRTVIDNLPVAVYAKDLQGRKTLANRADLNNIGLPEAEVLGKTDTEMFPPEVAAYFEADDQAVLTSGTPVVDREELLTNRDGKTFWQLTSKLPLYDADGQIVGLVGIGRDITGRKRAMAALQQREADLKEAQSIARLGRWELDLTTQQLQWSDSIFEIFEVNPEHFEASYEAFLDVIHPGDRAMVDHAYTASLRDGTPYEITHRLLMQDGRIKWLHEICRHEYDAQGEAIRSVGVVQDITERKQAEEALRAERDLVSRMMETSPAGITMVNIEGQIVFANPRAEQVLGLSRDQIHQRTYNDPAWRITDYNGEPFPEDALPFVQVQRTLRPVSDVRHAIEWPDGRRVLLQINAAPLLDENDAFNGIIASIADVTEHMQAENALRDSEERFRALFNQSMEGIYLHDLDGHILDVNIMACTQSGFSREEWLGLTIFDGFSRESTTNMPKADVLQAWRQWEPGQRWVIEAEHQRKDGTIYPVEISTGIIRYGDTNVILAIIKDITDRKQAEEALRESEQKYRALFEQMTEGFALHEIITDAQGVPCDYRFLEINPAYEQLTGLTRERCLGKTVLDVLPNMDSHWIADYGQVALTGEPVYLEDYVTALERYYEVWAYSPQPRQFATLVKDVTERRQQEIERAVLLDAEHEQRLRAETLSDVTLALASALATSDVLMEILHQAQRLVPSTASNIALMENDALHIVGWRGYAEVAAAYGDGNGQDLAAMLQPLSDFPINVALVATGRPYIVADTSNDPDWQHPPAMAWVRAHISLPIRLGERVLGVLRLDSEQVGAFTTGDVERLQPLARAAAIALENAQLYTQAQQELEERKRSQAALEASERKFREMLENVRLFAVMMDLQGRVTFCNDFGLAMVGMEQHAVLGCDWIETFIPPEIRAEMRSAFVENFHTGDFPAHYENEILTARGEGRALLAWNNIVIRDPDGDIIGVAAVGEDITARRQAERALQASEAWLRSFVDSMDDVIFSLDAEQRHTAIYGQWVERLGMTEAHFLGRTARDVFGPQAAPVHETANVQALATGSSVTYEWEVNGPEGRYHFQTTLSPLRDPEGEIVGLVGVGRDITALKNYHTQLQSALDEKTLMLSEIHHRIKNNLQVILGLLDLQFGAVEDEATQQMLRESQNRIKAIALIHERLYQTPGEPQIDAGLYFQSLVRYLTQTYDAQVRGIVVEQSIADLPLDIDLAIPCALIVNELITNALKYAFPPGWQSPDGAAPTLRVTLHHAADRARLEVVDNGVGLPKDLALDTSPRLGLRLIQMLVRQIEGELSVEQNAGTCVAVTFAWNEGK